MKIRSVETLDELSAAFDFMKSLRPRPPRDENHYLSRFVEQQPLFVIAEDDTGIQALNFGSTDGGAVFVDDYVRKEMDSEQLRADLLDAVVRGAEVIDAPELYLAVSWEAPWYEEMGCAPKLHVQIFGDQREEARKSLIRSMRGSHRVLGAGVFGPAVNVQFRTDRVDQSLMDEIEETTPGALGSSWIMCRWVGEAERSLGDGTVRHRRPKYLITHHPRFRRQVVDEVLEVDCRAAAQRLANDVGEFSVVTPGHDLGPAFLAENPIFARHVAPVSLVVSLEGIRSDLDAIAEQAESLPLKEGFTFAVQCRKGPATVSGRHDKTAYTIRDVEIAVGMRFGLTFDPIHPQQAISIYLEGSLACLGVSPPQDNLSSNPDETRTPNFPSTVISRAEHKLREAIEVFELALEPGQSALDLGAAPGGWTYLLAEAGLSVIAVDPARLDSKVENHPRVSHLKARADDSVTEGRAIDLVVNDMSTDPTESAEIMCKIAPGLRPGTPAIMTIKLPTLNAGRWLNETRQILEQDFEIQAIRHLFHNRQEVTALLHRK